MHAHVIDVDRRAFPHLRIIQFLSLNALRMQANRVGIRLWKLLRSGTRRKGLRRLGEPVTNLHSPAGSGLSTWPSRGAERMVPLPGVYSTGSLTRKTSPSRGSARP